MRILCVVAVLSACAPSDQAPQPPRQDPARSAAAVRATQAGQFDVAQREADVVLRAEPRDATAAAVRAIARYQRAGETLVIKIGEVIERGENLKFLDHEQGRRVWLSFLGELEAIDRDLAIAATDPRFALELCLACWEKDWNRSGEIDDRDRRLFELEFDGKGGELAVGDPRRRPTFRFDIGDVLWARAMISFQRGLVELVLAYQWSELDKLFSGNDEQRLVIKLVEPRRVKRARDLFIAGLTFSGQERDAYLRETDDDREWLPNPRQKSYAMPLAVDDKLYATWAAVLGDVQRMLTSTEGISLREAAALVLGNDDAQLMPNAYVDLGRMLREPADIVFDLRDGGSKSASIERIMRGLLGNGYAESMRASPLVGRLRHMRNELERGEDTVDRKLRYLFWIN